MTDVALCCAALPPSLIGALAYVIVAATVLLLGYKRFAREEIGRGQWRMSLTIAAVLLVLAVWQAGAGEARLLALLRGEARAEDIYQSRRHWQQLVATLMTIGVAAGAVWPIVSRRLRGPLTVAWIATLALIGLALMRLVSLHEIDAVLYKRLFFLNANRVAEAALLMGILAAAAVAPRWHRLRD